jgi:hypothetical protein
MTAAIGVEVDCPFTVGMLKKVTHAAAQSSSFAAAANDLQELAETKVTAKRVERWGERVGAERVEEARRQAEAYQALPLPEQWKSPTDQIPRVACVMMDGGRIQVRDRHAQQPEASGYWKESLVGCCLSMTSQEHASDPAPTIPQTFVDARRMNDLGREIKGISTTCDETIEMSPHAPVDREGRPETLVRSVVATRAGQESFGKRLVAEAYARGFHAARRKAFVADGGASNWGVHKKHFSHYTPVLDFTHAICYVYAAAMAGRSSNEAWQVYVEWAQWLWAGSIDTLIAAVKERSQQLGPPAGGDETSPAAIVARTLGYLTNQRSRMNYAEFRRLGLPITSSHIESTIKQINRRVKGSEKFWHHGAEPILQLAADRLSETKTMSQFWKQRPARLLPQRRHQTAA